MSNAFLNDISLNPIKEYVNNFLHIYCIKDGNYLYINKEIYKKYEINNKVQEFINYIKQFYKTSKKYFTERPINFNNFISILRHICKLLDIIYYKRIIYNNNSYYIVYYIENNIEHTIEHNIEHNNL
jgi:hypothetical protein